MNHTDFEIFINKNRLKKKDVAEYLGVSPAFITALYSGSRPVPPDKIDLIRLNPDWDTSMFTGDGEMLRESHSTSPVGNAATSADKSEMQQTQGSPAPTTENITNLIAITREAMAVIREQSAQMNRLITQVELSNARYDRLFASISGVSTGFPATPTDLGVKNPPPIKSELK